MDGWKASFKAGSAAATAATGMSLAGLVLPKALSADLRMALKLSELKGMSAMCCLTSLGSCLFHAPPIHL